MVPQKGTKRPQKGAEAAKVPHATGSGGIRPDPIRIVSGTGGAFAAEPAVCVPYMKCAGFRSLARLSGRHYETA